MTYFDDIFYSVLVINTTRTNEHTTHQIQATSSDKYSIQCEQSLHKTTRLFVCQEMANSSSETSSSITEEVCSRTSDDEENSDGEN